MAKHTQKKVHIEFDRNNDPSTTVITIDIMI